jgi:3-hydroxybutyryl-CoA dehydrogenase
MSSDTQKEASMSESGLKKIGVIGIGTMGNGISQVAAQSGFEVVVMDVDANVLERGMDAISRSLDRLVKAFEKSDGEKGITGEAKDEALGRLKTTSSLDGLLDCDLIIEAVPERPELKEKINHEVIEEEFGSFYKPSPLLKRLVESGQLGAKTGSGFYTWEKYKASGVNPDVARYRIK